MRDPDTAVVRLFNRSYTARIGALDESFLGMGVPLGTARLLYEIGDKPGTAKALRARLGLDSGYLSRLLRRLEADGLVAVIPDPADRRRRQVTLTARGRRRWRELETRSEERARALIDPLSERQRARLVTILAEADLLVRSATVDFEMVDPTSPAARSATGRYFAELDERFAGGFDAAGQAAADAESLAPPSGVFVVAMSEGSPVACGGVQTLGPALGEIKRMWVDEDWRGAGLGGRLLRHLEQEAVKLGHRMVRLDTNDTLTEAIALYERAGYRPVARYNDNPYARRWFEKPLNN